MTQPRWLDDDQQHVWRAYREMNRRLDRALEAQLIGDSGLSGADYAVLTPLSEEPSGVLRARELCAEIGWDRSRLSHHLNRMQKRGLIAREDCEQDARGLMVRLTPAGRKAIQEAAPGHADTVQRYLFDLLSRDELNQLGSVFDRVLENLDRCEP